MEDIKEKIDEYCRLKKEIRVKLIEYFIDFVNGWGVVNKDDKVVEFNYFTDLIDDYECAVGYPTISYDGGNHPERSSNCFSQVHSIGTDKNGSLFFGIEETDKYDIDRVWSLDELLDIRDLVDYIKINS